MDITTGIIVIGAIYGVLLFFDNFFKTCAHYPYIKFLEGTGFEIKFLSARWKTKAFNRTLIRWGSNKSSFLNIWFSLGLYASLLLLPVSVCLLLYSVLQDFSTGSVTEAKVVLEPIIPGVNLPASELGYYSLTLVLCSIVHEIGHAFAAVQENVNVIDVGANIFFIFPVAYVNLATETLSNSSTKNTLKILCAGIWHNIVLSLLAFLLYASLPTIFSFLFHVGKGITVIDIAKKSPLSGPKGLTVGDVILRINDCTVYDESSWYECLAEVEKHKPGFCLDADLVHSLDESIPLKHLENGNIDCCDESKSNVCFEYLDSADGILELPSYACLPARTIIEKSSNMCTLAPHTCPNNLFCFRPILTNTTNLYKISCRNKNIIYIGLARDIYGTTDISSYIPKRVFSNTVIPDVTTKFVKYIAGFSLGLAIINIIPFSYMDGQYIAEVLGYVLLKNRFGKNMSKLIGAAITCFFTVLLICHCLFVVFKILF